MTEIKSEHSHNYIDSPPEFFTDAADVDILTELIQREPIFHHPEFGRTRQELENMTDATFWEIGASGRRYSRDYTLTEVAASTLHPKILGRQKTFIVIKSPPIIICSPILSFKPIV
jgi:hypothetical protein